VLSKNFLVMGAIADMVMSRQSESDELAMVRWWNHREGVMFRQSESDELAMVR